MGLLSILRKIKQKEREMRILILGLDNAGKTTVVKRLMGADVSEVSPTLGFSIVTMTLAGFQLSLWDIGGQKTIRPYWRNYFEQTDGVVWVVDSSDRERIASGRDELDNLLKEEVGKKSLGGKKAMCLFKIPVHLAGASLLVLANKQDLPGALPAADVAAVLGIAQLGESARHWRVDGCSAISRGQPRHDDESAAGADRASPREPKTDELRASFEWLVQDIGSRVYMYD